MYTKFHDCMSNILLHETPQHKPQHILEIHLVDMHTCNTINPPINTVQFFKEMYSIQKKVPLLDIFSQN